MRRILVVAAMAVWCGSASGAVYITEWMYNPAAPATVGEYVELTNLGGLPVSLAGWSFDDNSEMPGSQSLTALGTLTPGESAIFTEDTEANFRAVWGLSASVKVLGGNTNNLGRADEINIYDNNNALVDRLTYDDQSSGNTKGPRTNGTSAWTSVANLGTNNASAWKLSSVGDAQNSFSMSGQIGNPGTYVVPEPMTVALLTGAGVLLRGRRKEMQ